MYFKDQHTYIVVTLKSSGPSYQSTQEVVLSAMIDAQSQQTNHRDTFFSIYRVISWKGRKGNFIL